MEYWIIKDNGDRVGPLTLEQLMWQEIHSLTPVWRQGLSDWTPARDVPEVAARFGSQQYTPQTTDGATADAQVTIDVVQPVVDSCDAGDICTPAGDIPAGYVIARPGKCPPTYLALSIVCTIIFFTILGVFAIINASKVKKRFAQGDFDGAVKASERAALFAILSIVVELIWAPFQIVVSMF